MDQIRRALLGTVFNVFLISILHLSLVFAAGPPPTVVPPPAAVPEGNVFTAFALVGSGLYLLWLKGGK